MLDEQTKVLLLIQDLELCGAQRQLVELAKGLDKKRYDVRIGTLEPSGPLTEDLRDLGLPVLDFARYWRWDLSPILRLAAYLRRERIDVVHAYHSLPNFFSRFAGRLAGTRAIISSVRGTGIGVWYRYFLDVATSFMCHAYIANSEAGHDHYVCHGGPKRKMLVIKNGIDLNRFTDASSIHDYRMQWDLSRFDQLIGMVAALEYRKDQHLLIQSMREIIRHHPRTGLLLLGDGSRRSFLESVAYDEGLQDHIVFTGSVRLPEQIYPLFDIYVQASYSEEGISNSIMEAMSCSLPVIATDVGGNREVVTDQVTGYIVAAGDQDALTQAILDLLNDPTRRRQMGRAGLARVRQDFSLEGMVAATQRLYDTLLGVHVPSRQGSIASVSSKESH